MFKSIEDAKSYALQFSAVAELGDKDLNIIVKDLYLNAEDYIDARAIITKWVG